MDDSYKSNWRGRQKEFAVLDIRHGAAGFKIRRGCAAKGARKYFLRAITWRNWLSKFSEMVIPLPGEESIQLTMNKSASIILI
jgi:hypothetical protein